MIITEEQIQIAEKAGACESALDWLREKPRTWIELFSRNNEWFYWAIDLIPFPQDILNHFMESDIEDLKQSVLFNRNITSEMIVIISQQYDESFWIKKRIADHIKTPVEILSKYSKDESLDIRSALARNPSSSTEILRDLYKNKDFDGWVTYSLAQNPSSPVDILWDILQNNDSYEETSIAENPSINDDIINYIINNGLVTSRCRLAHNQALSLDQIKILLKDKNPNVHEHVARYSKYQEVHKILLNSDNTEIKYNLALNINISSEDLETISENSPDFVLASVVCNPNVSSSTLHKIAVKNRNLDSRIIVQPSVSVETLQYIISESVNNFVIEQATQILNDMLK